MNQIIHYEKSLLLYLTIIIDAPYAIVIVREITVRNATRTIWIVHVCHLLHQKLQKELTCDEPAQRDQPDSATSHHTEIIKQSHGRKITRVVVESLNNNFVLACLDLGIPNMEYHNMSNKQVRNTSIQEWSDYTIQQFTEHQKVLEQSEKQQLSSYLIQCEEKLRLTKSCRKLHWKA